MILTTVLMALAAQGTTVSDETLQEWQQWRRCIAVAALPQADSQRPIDRVVDEAMTHCEADERAMQQLAVRDLGRSRGTYYMRGFRNQMRLDTIREIAARRARPMT